MRIQFHFLICFLLSIFFILSSASKEKIFAKKRLQEIGIQITNEEFLKQIKLGDEQTVKLFIQAGIDLNSTRSLIYSIVCRQRKISKLLVEEGADPNMKTEDKVTVLMMASKLGDEDLVKLLVQKGADTNVRDDYGNDVFHWAKSHPNIVKILREN
jgi:ankyrin repeat protein